MWVLQQALGEQTWWRACVTIANLIKNEAAQTSLVIKTDVLQQGVFLSLHSSGGGC